LFKRSLVAALCSGVTLAAGATSAWAATVADMGFRPNPNGFSFENYGNDAGYQNLTSVEMQRLFGRIVCADSAGTPTVNDPAPSSQSATGRSTSSAGGSSTSPSGSGTSSGSSSGSSSTGTPGFAGAAEPSPCNLTPPAQQWMDTQNNGMNGGHCQGFAVLAERLFKNQFPPFGTGTTYSLQAQGNTALQHAIAYAFVSQFLDSVVNARIKGTPNDILNTLKTGLTPNNNETYTLGIYKPDGSGGHAITPFAVEDLGGGKFAVDVYDNNYPGDTRQVMFDTNANTWSYNAAINPSVAPELYSGSADNPQIELDPTTPGEGVQPCPFCGGANAARDAAARLDTVQLQGNLHYHAHLLITDGAGQLVGVLNGAIVNTFRGAQVQPTLQSDYSETQEPAYLIPSRNVTITVDGSHLQHSDTEALSDVGPGQDLAVQNLKIGAGQKDVVKLSNGLEHLALTLAKGKSSGSPVIHIGADSSKGDVALELKLVRPKPGSTVHVKLDPAKQLITFYSTGNRGAATYMLSAVKETAKAKIVEGSDTLTLRGQQSVTYSYAK
jgi:hypothetical protein